MVEEKIARFCRSRVSAQRHEGIVGAGYRGRLGAFPAKAQEVISGR
jgi:hypothetical protein